MITNIKIFLPNPDNRYFIEAPHDNVCFKGNEKIIFKQDADKLNEMLESFPIGTVRELFKLLQDDPRVNT